MGKQVSACALYVLQGHKIGSADLANVGVRTEADLERVLENIGKAMNGATHDREGGSASAS
jgi:hypothetical protein